MTANLPRVAIEIDVVKRIASLEALFSLARAFSIQSWIISLPAVSVGILGHFTIYGDALPGIACA